MLTALSELGIKYLLQLDQDALPYVDEEDKEVSAFLEKLKKLRASEESAKSPDQKNNDSK